MDNNHTPQLVILGLQAFAEWMAEFYINNNSDITTPTCLYSPKQILTTTRLTLLCCLLQLPTHLVPQDHLPCQFQACLTLKSPSSTSKRKAREIYLHIPHSRVRSTMTPSKALWTFLTPNSAPNTETPLLNYFSVSSSPSCTLFW